MKIKQVKFSIYALAFLLLGSNAISPAMASISQAFPKASATAIQMVLQIPAFISVPFILLSGVISSRFDKKLLIMLGLGLYTLGGLLGTVVNTYGLLMASRCIFGVGFGILIPCSMGLVSDLFFGTADYGPMIGYENAFKSFGSICISLAAGYLCLINWHCVFFLYGLGIIVFILLALYLPRIPPSHKIQKENRQKEKIPGVLIPAVILGFWYSLCMSCNGGHMSYLIEGSGFGDSSASGWILSFCTVASVAGSIVYSKTNNRLGNKALPIGVVCSAAGLLCCAFATGLWMVFVGDLFIGAGLGFANPSLLMVVGRHSKASSTMFFSFIMAGMNLGSMCSSFVTPNVASAIFGGAGLGRYGFLVSGVGQVLSVLMALTLVYKFRTKLVKA